MSTIASDPFNWFWPRVMRTLPRMRAMPVTGLYTPRSPRTISCSVRISTLPKTSTRSSFEPSPGARRGCAAPARTGCAGAGAAACSRK